VKIALALLAALIFLAAVVLLPVPIPAYLDFQVIYHADLGLLRGISLYDHAGQVNMIAQLAKVPADQVYVLPFPYPPWYALSTLWLALLSISMAARLWFGLNLVMLFASVLLMTSGWPVVKRLLSLLLATLWLPALGSLFVGQYGFPVLLGAALMIFALRREHVILVGVAAALLTFKPHLGVLIVLIVLAYLWMRQERFGKAAATGILITGVVLFAIAFLASPRWPLDYFHSLTGFRDVSQCHQCVSLPMAAAGLAGGGLDQAIWLALAVFVLLVIWLARMWRRIAGGGDRLIAAAVLMALLASPYLQNYDYLLLLVPLIMLASTAMGPDWIWLGLAYAVPSIWLALAYTVPTASLAPFVPAGNFVLVYSALILFIYAARHLARAGTTASAL
jgi:alpha-1,2-mannosyltransferase